MSLNKAILMCCSRPGEFAKDQIRSFMEKGVSVAFSGYGESGLNIASVEWLEELRDVYAHLQHVIPLKGASELTTGNGYKWKRIIEDWKDHGPVNPLVYILDEIYNRDLWGCPFDPYTERVEWMNWKRQQLIDCQKILDNTAALNPKFNHLVTSDRPVPAGSVPLNTTRIVRAYRLDHLALAWEWFGDKWRRHYGFAENDVIGCYTVKPIFGTYQPEQIGDMMDEIGLKFFLYYRAQDPDIWDGGRATSEMIRLWKAIRR